MAERLRMAVPLLSDPVRTVRVEAVRTLAIVPADTMNERQRSLFLGGVEEYRAAQLANAERPEAHLNLGWLAASQGDQEAAEREYKVAIDRDPLFIPAYINLADLYRAQGRESEGEEQLRQALEIGPDVAEIHHSLGCFWCGEASTRRLWRRWERAVELAPEESRFAYVYAVALHDLGDVDRVAGGAPSSP